MIHSMTGYGKAESQIGTKKYNIQLRSLNSKQADITVKLPSALRELELKFRKIISTQLQRGKIEMYLSCEKIESEKKYKIDELQFENFYHQIKLLKTNFNLSESDELAAILKLPEVIQSTEEEDETIDESALNSLLDLAIKDIKSFRRDEGETLATDLKFHIVTINNLLKEALQYEEERTITVRNRILSNLEDSKQKDSADMDRFEQEMIYYMEKYDISEEKVRLKAHCDYFLETMQAESGQGKKLGFISQEIGREINTLGSKANHAQMQKLVVQMKDQLEKIKEQVLNVL